VATIPEFFRFPNQRNWFSFDSKSKKLDEFSVNQDIEKFLRRDQLKVVP